MLFNSGVFLQFFAAFLLLYWLVRRHLAARNLLLVVASYVFYGWWNVYFLSLLFFSSTFDYFVGRGLQRLTVPRSRRLLLAGSVAVNLGLLGFFKYYNFFVDSMKVLFARLDLPFHPGTLHVLLPVGLSFYTFQSMSYAIDVYRGQLKPTRNYINFLAYVSFFPQLVAGPIQRASHLMPQFERTVVITRPMLQEGVWLMLWGMFKKVVVADNFAPLADLAFAQQQYSAAGVLMGVAAFAVQIYCDFSGYSDIARGCARILGFDMMWNFDLPYAAANLRDFWRRWHISLSTWLRDYLYISLGGNRKGPLRTHANLIVTMLLGGLWHGAAWNFVLWGLWHGVGLSVHRLWDTWRSSSPSNPKTAPVASEPVATDGQEVNGSRAGSWRGLTHVLSWAVTMLFVGYGWLLFRARSWEQIVRMTVGLGNSSLPPWTLSMLSNGVAFALPIVALESWQVYRRNRLVALTLPPFWQALLQGALLYGILLFWQKKEKTFIYFQF
jgi:D-alanyl-lipoteichoic acid acyltransferase DltB (MBOAT superfamily)